MSHAFSMGSASKCNQTNKILN